MNDHGTFRLKCIVRTPRVEVEEREIENPKLVSAFHRGGDLILVIEEQPDAQQDP